MPRPSRCLDAARAPQVVHWAEVSGDRTVVSEELVAAVKESVDASLVVDTVQDVQALLTRVEQCQLGDPKDVVPVARHPFLWEIKLNDHSAGVHLRIYCAEVPELPNTIVALHAHAKFTAGSAGEVQSRQDQAISLAMMRFESGRKDLWGIKRSASRA